MKKFFVCCVVLFVLMMSVMATAETTDEETWFKVSFKLPENNVLWVEDPDYNGDVIYINYDVTKKYDTYWGGNWAELTVTGLDQELLEGPVSIIVVSYDGISKVELINAINEQLAQIVGVELEYSCVENELTIE